MEDKIKYIQDKYNVSQEMATNYYAFLQLLNGDLTKMVVERDIATNNKKKMCANKKIKDIIHYSLIY